MAEVSSATSAAAAETVLDKAQISADGKNGAAEGGIEGVEVSKSAEKSSDATTADQAHNDDKESSTIDNGDWKARREADQRRDNDRRRGGGFRSRGGHRDSRGNENRAKFSKNVKSDYSQQPESSDPDEIRKQVEFYFSDSNLPTDQFLFDKVGGGNNNAVPISVIHSFKRMRHFQPFSAVVAALKDSTFLEVVDNDTAVRRQKPLPATFSAESHAQNVELMDDATRPRSIYAKGFGREGPTTQFDIEAFFAPYGPTNAIRLRRHADKTFKGSVFVEFDSEETQAAFLALDPKPKWEGKELSIMSKEQYVRGKAEDIAAGRIKGSERKNYRQNGHRGRGGHRGGRGTHGGRSSRDDHRKDDGANEEDDFVAAETEKADGEGAHQKQDLDTEDSSSFADKKKRSLPDSDENTEASSKKAKTQDESGPAE